MAFANGVVKVLATGVLALLTLGFGIVPLASAADPVESLEVVATTKPVISGTVEINHTLKTKAPEYNVWDVSTDYQWYATYPGTSYRNKIPDATGKTYKVSKSWAGYRISVTAFGTRAGYTPGEAKSASTKSVPYLAVTGKTPTIWGTFKVGKTIKAGAGSWKPGGMQFHYVWRINGAGYAETEKPSFTIPKAAKGKRITVTVTGIKIGYKLVSMTSKSSSKVK